MSTPEIWFAACGRIDGRKATMVVADGRLVDGDPQAITLVLERVHRGGHVGIAGIYAGTAGLGDHLQAAATVIAVFDPSGLSFDPPLPVSEVPPGHIAGPPPPPSWSDDDGGEDPMKPSAKTLLFVANATPTPNREGALALGREWIRKGLLSDEDRRTLAEQGYPELGPDPPAGSSSTGPAESWLRPVELPPLRGPERLGEGDVLDFWRWALGDLRMNNARGYLAEYLVAQAVGDDRPIRIEWGAHDVEAADGTRIEVKATGRLQSWVARRPPAPVWSFGSIRSESLWSEDLATYVKVDPWDRVDVWVFALQTATDPAAYDPLDLDHWEFRVLPHRTVLAAGQASARVSTIERLGATPVTLAGLADEVRRARDANDRTDRPTKETP